MPATKPKPRDRLREHAENFCADTGWEDRPNRKVPFMLAMALLHVANSFSATDKRRKTLEAVACAVADRCQEVF